MQKGLKGNSDRLWSLQVVSSPEEVEVECELLQLKTLRQRLDLPDDRN